MARGGGGRRSYVRDNSGRFSSTPGGGPARASPGARRAAKATGGTLAARAQLRAARAKLTPGASRQQRGAVTRASNRLKGATTAGRMQRPGATTAGRITKRKGLQADPQAAAKLAAGQKRSGRQPNLRAQQAKAMANRTGVVPGRLRTDGQDVRTMSLRELRAAVRKDARRIGVADRSQFEFMYGLGSGLTKTGKNGLAAGRMPKTRGDWEKIYKRMIGMPQSDLGRKARPGVINGIDIQKNFRPWAVFGLDPKTATKADVESAYRRVAKQVHPDAGGRRKDFERVKTMRDSVLAMMPKPKPAKPRSGKSAAAAPAAPRGPKLLPPARSAPPRPPRKPRRRKPAA